MTLPDSFSIRRRVFTLGAALLACALIGLVFWIRAQPDPGGAGRQVVLTLPPRASEADGAAFALSRAGWIRGAQAAMPAAGRVMPSDSGCGASIVAPAISPAGTTTP